MAIRGNFNTPQNLQTTDGLNVLNKKINQKDQKVLKVGPCKADFHSGKDAYDRIRPGDTYDGKVVTGVHYKDYNGKRMMVVTMEDGSTARYIGD